MALHNFNLGVFLCAGIYSALAWKNKKIFKLIKFRTMSNQKEKEGNLLPDEIHLNKYGRILRMTSIDKLPEALIFSREI